MKPCRLSERCFREFCSQYTIGILGQSWKLSTANWGLQSEQWRSALVCHALLECLYGPERALHSHARYQRRMRCFSGKYFRPGLPQALNSVSCVLTMVISSDSSSKRAGTFLSHWDLCQRLSHSPVMLHSWSLLSKQIQSSFVKKRVPISKDLRKQNVVEKDVQLGPVYTPRGACPSQ